MPLSENCPGIEIIVRGLQSCIDGSGWFKSGIKCLWIFHYCISLVNTLYIINDDFITIHKYVV